MFVCACVCVYVYVYVYVYMYMHSVHTSTHVRVHITNPHKATRMADTDNVELVLRVNALEPLTLQP